MSSSAEHLLAALLEHQQNNHLHSDIKIAVDDDTAVCSINKGDDQPLRLEVPPLLGHALAELLLKKIGLPRGRAGTWQEGFLDEPIAGKRQVALVRIAFADAGEIITLSFIDPDLGEPDNLFTSGQRAVVVDALDARTGLVGVSGPTLGSTITALHAIEELLKEYATPRHVQVATSLGMDTCAALQNTLHRLPAFVLTALPEDAADHADIWHSLTQAAIAGSVIVVGVPGHDTASLVRLLHDQTPSFLWKSLFQLTVVHAPFPSACPSCAIPMPVHPDVAEQFARHTDPALLHGLKSAHAPGCEACGFHGTGPTVGAVELCTPDMIPENFDALGLANALRQRGMKTIIDDLVRRASHTPMPLTRVAQLWRG